MIKTGDLLAKVDLPKDVRVVIDHALQNNGCIAGGFARRLACEHFNLNKIDVNDLKASKYDIDLFFFSKENFYDAKPRGCHAVEMHHDGSESMSGYNAFADNYYFEGIKVQFVHQINKNVKMLLESFDIANSCVAYSNDHLFILNYDNWLSLETSKTVKMNQWNDYTPLRCVKYRLEHGYKTIDKESQNTFFKRLASGSISDTYAFRQYKECLTNDELLEISMYVSHDQKKNDIIKKELISRSNVKDLCQSL